MMRAQLSVLVGAVFACFAVAHDDHEHGEQMPLGYFKYPYQAIYPGDNEGEGMFRITGFTSAE